MISIDTGNGSSNSNNASPAEEKEVNMQSPPQSQAQPAAQPAINLDDDDTLGLFDDDDSASEVSEQAKQEQQAEEPQEPQASTATPTKLRMVKTITIPNDEGESITVKAGSEFTVVRVDSDGDVVIDFGNTEVLLEADEFEVCEWSDGSQGEGEAESTEKPAGSYKEAFERSEAKAIKTVKEQDPAAWSDAMKVVTAEVEVTATEELPAEEAATATEKLEPEAGKRKLLPAEEAKPETAPAPETPAKPAPKTGWINDDCIASAKRICDLHEPAKEMVETYEALQDARRSVEVIEKEFADISESFNRLVAKHGEVGSLELFDGVADDEPPAVVERPKSEQADGTVEQSSAYATSLGIPDNDWRALSIDVLGLPPSLAEKLRENPDMTIATIGNLSDWTSKFLITDIKGVGQKKAESIEAALDSFWEKNPAYCKE